MDDKYNNKLFKEFAIKLKKNKLWGRFKILEYYFRAIGRQKSYAMLYDAMKHPDKYWVINDILPQFPLGEELYLDKIFEYYRV